jgi:hypothetical protein
MKATDSLVEGLPFFVNERPFCLWDFSPREINLEFINGIDPDYFGFLADVYTSTSVLDDQQGQAALALRTSYSHGLETLFSLLFAALQAPDCVVGWLQKYGIDDLRLLIVKARDSKPIRTRIRPKPITWSGISAMIFGPASFEGTTKTKAEIVDSFAILWSRLSKDFLDRGISAEYNGVKHGLRVRSGGFRLALGQETVPGEPAPPENMRPLGGSAFGSSFFSLEKIEPNALNYQIKRHSRNWSPDNLAYGLHMIAFSTRNILAFLQIVNGMEPSQAKFSWPNDSSHFDGPWSENVSVTSFSSSPMLHIENHLLGEKEIFFAYDQD